MREAIQRALAGPVTANVRLRSESQLRAQPVNWIFMLRALAARKLLQLLSYRYHAVARKPIIHPARYTTTTAQ